MPDTGPINRNPNNINLLSSLGFKFSVQKLPHVSWFVQEASIPAVTMNEVVQPNPFGYAYLPGDKIEYDILNIIFKVDEELNTWVELQNWMTGIGSPRGFEEYANNIRNNGQSAIVSDATLTILNSVKNPKFEVLFKDLFPTSIGELRFSSTNSDVEYVTINATFRYLNYEFRRITS